MEPESSLPHPQAPAICPYPEPALPSPYPHIPKSHINTRKKNLFQLELWVRLCALTMPTETHTGPRVKWLYFYKISTETEIAFNIFHRISENTSWSSVQLFSKGQVHVCADRRTHKLRNFNRRSAGMRMWIKHVINTGRQPNYHRSAPFSQRQSQ